LSSLHPVKHADAQAHLYIYWQT